jgi:cysteine desulfurase
VGAHPSEIFFTSGGTEADNHAVKGIALASRRTTGRTHLVVSAVEHHAVLSSARELEGMGFTVSILPVDSAGRVKLDEADTLFRDDTCLVAVMHANNEIGTVQPIREISELVRARRIPFHCDMVQALGKIALQLDSCPVDTAAFSAHKIHGPKGIGALFIRRGAEVDSLIHGGSQERNRRGGTENVPLVAGFAVAAEKAVAHVEETRRSMQSRKDLLRTLLASQGHALLWNGGEAETLPNIISVSIDSSRMPIDGEALLMNLDLNGLAVSSGSACASGSMETSHVLKAIGRDAASARATVRFSLGIETTEAELRRAASIFDTVIHTMTS